MPDSILETAAAVNPTYIYVGAFVDELCRSGVKHVVICPGSRSTPLALTFAAQPELRCWMHVDERSAAFFALGMAKRLGQAVALLCTSGTGAANFFPALVEARLAHVPLIVLTADRPHELRDCGAPQAIDQNRLYGTHVKWFVDVALPEASSTTLRTIRTIANRAASLAHAVPPGPVHLNFPFREPLTPEPLPDHPVPTLSERDPLAWGGRPNNAPFVRVTGPSLAAPSADTITHVAHLTANSPRGLIVVGPQQDPTLAAPLVALARHLGYPILADPLSQLRCGDHDHHHVLSSYDAFLRSQAFNERVTPQLILRFGAPPTSKPVSLYLKRHASCPQLIIDGFAGWEEPLQTASELIYTHPPLFCQELLAALLDPLPQAQERHDWLATWQQAEHLTRAALCANLKDLPPFFEGRIFTELQELLPSNTSLYVGNSMPVRDLDTFFWNTSRPIRILGNRGANGIDGIVSSALGASAVADKHEPTVLVIGDLSFYHDLNGLLAARLHQLNLVIVLVNNDGGGIFSFLPQAAYPEHFERFFGTPTGLDFQQTIQMYGGHFLSVENWDTLRRELKHSLDLGGLHVIEVRTERSSNVTLHRYLWQCVERALSTIP